MLQPEYRAPVAEAGFGYGSDTYLQKFFEAFRQVVWHYFERRVLPE